MDCLAFPKEINAEVIQELIATQSENIFHFSTDNKFQDDSKLAEYDYRNHQWNAGRFIGEAFFQKGDAGYKITIKPRFGEKVLFKMLEEIFNIRITKSSSQQTKSEEWQHYIKRIIAFIWIQKLANANLHGLPRWKTDKINIGHTIKGRLAVRKSILPYYQYSAVVSINKEKIVDPTIANILYQAYNILRSDFSLGQINMPDSAKDALAQIGSIGKRDYVSAYDYQKIRYNDIYLSWKSVIDFSWDIIQRKQLSLKQKKSANGLGFFIDMAEVWEQYLRSLLKKKLMPLGWNLNTEKQIAYKGLFFKREFIPDLVFQRGKRIVIWDAKYKRMKGEFWDVDRSDFFQIHTYIQHFVNQYEVKAGGLLYPISTVPDYSKYQSPLLLNENGLNIPFSINGLEVQEDSQNEDMEQKEQEFVNRVIQGLE